MMLSFRRYIFALMNDKRDSWFDVIVKGILRVLSWIYAVAVRIVDWSYRSGIRGEHKVAVPVVSVGNITLGGTGKTPFTIYLADHFLAEGRKPAVLTRGYGNDENRMLRDELPDVPVLVGQDRVRNARLAAKNGRDVLILDDGFQHRRIKRDVNILLLDSVSLFGNGSLFPRGILREPVSSLRRADIYVLTKTDRIGRDGREKIVRELADIAQGKPVVSTRHRPSFLADVTGAAYSAESLKGKKICIVSGIVDPDYFAFVAGGLGAAIVSRFDYGDHHRYLQADIDSIYVEAAKSKAESIIVTMKDYIKIKDLDISRIEEKLYILHIVMEITDGKEDLIAGLNCVSSG